MPIESATYIDTLDPSNPVGGTDTVSTLDNHDRLIKQVLQNSFPGISGAVTSTHTELNLLDGILSYTGTGTAIVKSVSPALTGTATAENLTVSGTLAASGASLTALDADALASGTVPDARFPATLPALNGSALTALNASNLASGTIPAARVGASSVTQHVAAINHDALLNFVAAEHRNTTISTSAPSGGADGDVWLRYS